MHRRTGHRGFVTGSSGPVGYRGRVTATRLELTREQLLAYRRAATHLDVRLPAGAASLRKAAQGGLTDSMPRAAVLSVHARVEGTRPDVLDDPALDQVWGLRYSAYAVAADDRAPFTLGRLSDNPKKRAFSIEMADRLEAFLDGRRLDVREAGRGLGVHPNALRYGAPTGRVLIRWDGARQPTVWTAPAPPVTPEQARLELARRYLHVFGAGTAEGFGEWAGLRPPSALAGIAGLEATGELLAVSLPIGDAWSLAADEPALRAAATPGHPAPARLLPSGDTWYLLQGADRALLVPEADRRARLWTSRVWPGAVLVGGELVGTWRRANAKLSIEPWRTLTAREREAVEQEAVSLPLIGLEGRIAVSWDA
jgi:hypothetical protein